MITTLLRKAPWGTRVGVRAVSGVVHPDTPATHVVQNQASLLEDFSVYGRDTALQEAIAEHGAQWAEPQLQQYGQVLGSAQWLEHAALANENKPALHTHDRHGNRVDVAKFHPSYHAVLGGAIEHAVHALPYLHDRRRGSNVARAAMLYMHFQTEGGTACPLSMTFASVPVLETTPEVAREWVPRVTSTSYDPRSAPPSEKSGVMLGMSMTEKQGGSDVRANTTRAVPLVPGEHGPAAQYALTGHKWFTSAPMSDGFLTLGYAERPDGGGDPQLSCFLVPRWLPDGTRNHGLQFQRLKDKVGDRSNASSEVEYRNAWGQMVGEPGRGVNTILEMVVRTRLDCSLGSAALMRAGVNHALHHATQRNAFGATLIDQGLMRNVLADLQVESEAATTLAMRVARAFDDADADEAARPFQRIVAAISKYYLCKRAPHAVVEAMECLGGNGYVEDYPMARLFRQSPLNGIWEGSGNVIALDVLRAMTREPETVPALLQELEATRGNHANLDAAVDDLHAELKRGSEDMPHRARVVVEKMARTLQGSLLTRHGDPAVAEAFCDARLAQGGPSMFSFGALPASHDLAHILDRAAGSQ